MQPVNLFALFLTGLLAGGFTCMAVQGGLLAATLVQREDAKLQRDIDRFELKAKNKWAIGNNLPILSFLGAKLIAYTILGFLLGYVGAFFKPSLPATIFLQIVVSVFMIGTAFAILKVHPIFRYFIIQPPHFLTRLIRQQTKSHDIFAPAILGAFTVFIPCGATQAVMALALGVGSPWLSALMLFSFTLGTTPIFFVFGYLATKITASLQRQAMRIAAWGIIVLALFTLNSSITLTGTPYTPGSMLRNAYCTITFCADFFTPTTQPVTDQVISIDNQGYTPNHLTVATNSHVTLHLENKGTIGCQETFTMPAYNIVKSVPVGQSGTVSFIAPNQPTKIAFMCAAGLHPGEIDVLKM